MMYTSQQLRNVGSAVAGRTLSLHGIWSKHEAAETVIQTAKILSLSPDERGKELLILSGSHIGLVAGALLGSRFGPTGVRVGKTLCSIMGSFLAKLLYDCCHRPAPVRVKALPAAPVVIDC